MKGKQPAAIKPFEVICSEDLRRTDTIEARGNLITKAVIQECKSYELDTLIAKFNAAVEILGSRVDRHAEGMLVKAFPSEGARVIANQDEDQRFIGLDDF